MKNKQKKAECPMCVERAKAGYPPCSTHRYPTPPPVPQTPSTPEKTEYMKGFEQGLWQAKARIKCWVLFDYMRGASMGMQEEYIDVLNKALDRTIESYE